jgi:DNA replication protein DnaC
MTECVYSYNCNHADCEKPFCEKKFRLDFLYDKSLLSEHQRKKVELMTDADGTDLKPFQFLAYVSENIEQFVEEGRNLYIYSANCGNGKTSWSVRLLQSYLNKIWWKSALNCRVLFISVPKFLLATKENITQKSEYLEKVLEGLKTADLVVWDDIAAKVGTEWEVSQLLSLIDNRLILGKSNIFTSNLDAQEIAKALGDRLASRICQMSQAVPFYGADKRQFTFNN